MRDIPEGTDLPLLTRRRLLIGATLVGGCLLVGGVAVAGNTTRRGEHSFGPFLRFTPDGDVIVVSKHSEMGQGAHSGLAAIVAEELDADWARVRVEMASADSQRYEHTVLKGLQITGGSSSISNSWDQLRRVGAAARGLFIEAAARDWQVAQAEIDVRDGVVLHKASGRTATFGGLLQVASTLTPPEQVQLKSVDQYRLIGTDKVVRLDLVAKSTGKQQYTADIQPPGLLVAMVAHPPRFGGRVASYDAEEVLKVPGITDVFSISTGVAVVATDTYSALKGREVLKVEWDDRAAEMRSSEEIHLEHREIAGGLRPASWMPFQEQGTAPSLSGDGIEDYCLDFPFLAHATMEPMNCVASVDGKRVQLQYGAQSQTADQQNIAPLVGCKPSEVEIRTVHSGGSFGRRSVARSDYQRECVEIARHIGGGRPVKLLWTREDDMTRGEYRAIVHHRARVQLGTDGYPVGWDHRIVCARMLAGTLFDAPGAAETAEFQSVEGVKDNPYFRAIPRVRAAVAYTQSAVTTLWLRSVGHTHTAMAMEHTIDRLAYRAGIDPVAYRREMYRRAGEDRQLAVLELAAEKAGWDRPLSDGWARGVAVHQSFGSVVANVVELSLLDGKPKVHRVVVVVDCGIAVSPDQIRAQMEGGVIYGLSIALYGEVKLDKGIPTATNFHNYRVLRMDESPDIETHIVSSSSAPTGIGEPGTPVIAPALANAMLALTGVATERLPVVQS